MIPEWKENFKAFMEELEKNGFFEGASPETYKIRQKLAETRYEEETKKALAEQYKKLGNKRFVEKKFNIAKKLFTKAIELYPTFVYYCNLGITYEQVGDTKKAIECLEKSVELEPTYLKALSKLVINYMDAGLLQKSIAYLKDIWIKPFKLLIEPSNLILI